MEQVIDLLQTSLESSQEDFQQILSSFTEHKVFLRKGFKVDSVVSQINALLNSDDNRAKGVLLLHAFLPQCSSSVLATHGFFWMQQCLKSAEQDAAILILELQTLGHLFTLSAESIDLRKNVVNTLLPKFFDKLDGKGSKEIRAAKMKCLINVMSHYAGACGLRRGIIDKFIQKSLKVMSEDDKEWLADACKCYLLLAQCGGSGNQGSIHKGNWSQQVQVLLNTAHSLLDSLFDSVTEIQVSKTLSADVTEKKLGAMESVPTFENSLARYNFYSSMFYKTMKALQIMLLGAFPAPKSIMPIAVFNLICRGLAVNCKTVSKSSLTLDRIALVSVIPFIHVGLLDTLDALIKCCGRNLIPYGSLICKLTCQSLKWTNEEWEYALEKPYKSVRISTYKALQSWLNCSRLASCIEPFLDEIIELLEKDFKYQEPTIKLQDKNQSGDAKGKRKKITYAQDEEVGRKDLSKTINVTCNKDVCRESLVTLQLILQAAPQNLTASQHKDLQVTIVKLLLDIHQSSSRTIPLPYLDVSCRLQLYRTLHFLVMESHSDSCPPTTYSAFIFMHGLRDSSHQVSSFCAEALSSIEKIIHPICNSLYFPNEVSDRDDQHRSRIIQAPSSETPHEEESLNDVSHVSESILSDTNNLTRSSEGDTTKFSINTSRLELDSAKTHPSPLLQRFRNSLGSAGADSPKSSDGSFSSGSMVTVVENPAFINKDKLATSDAIIHSSEESKSKSPQGGKSSIELNKRSAEAEEILIDSEENSREAEVSSTEPPQKKPKTKESDRTEAIEAPAVIRLDQAETGGSDDEVQEMLGDFVDLVNEE